MSLEQWLALLAFGITLLVYSIRLSYRLGALTLKVDTMWEFLMKRGTIEGQERGHLRAHSPLQVSDEMKQAFVPLMDNLRAFYVEKGTSMLDLELMLELERHFGDEIVKNICIPYKITNGACLVIAAKLLREAYKP